MRSESGRDLSAVSTMEPLKDALPSHLAPLVPSEWGVWRWFVLRGAGFPADRMDLLSEPGCASAADALVFIENDVEERFQLAIRFFNETLDRFTAEGRGRDDQHFKAVLRVRRRLADRKLPAENHGSPQSTDQFSSIRDAIRQRECLRLQFEDCFSKCIAHQSDVLQTLALDPKFQEAVIWQNRHAFETGVRSVALGPKGTERNNHLRAHEELVANYMQRYCVKNDTIGFFGPAAWGRVDFGDQGLGDQGQGLEVASGPSLVKRRRTYFENWAVDKVAASLSMLEGMNWWIPPRLAPDILIEQRLLHRPGGSPVPLNALDEAVLSLCDGKRLPGEILHAIHGNPQFGDASRQDLSSLLEAKVAEGVLSWRLLVPIEVNAEIGLRQQLLKLGDPRLREVATERLDRLDAARRRVEGSAGDPARLCAAVHHLEREFEEIAKSPGSRNPGVTYGARTIVYEDCQRDMTIKLSPELIMPAMPAFSLLFRSLRWLLQSTAQEFHRIFRQTYRHLAGMGGSPDVLLTAWWLYTEPKLMEASPIADLESLFKEKWGQLLQAGQSHSPVQLESRLLEDEVNRLFPEPGAGFYPVRYYCPDLMFSAKDVEAIRRGELLYVLGEVHAGKNSISHVALVEQHPNPQELLDATAWDLCPGSFKILHTQQDSSTNLRTTDGLICPADYLLASTLDAVAPSGFDSHPMSELLLREQEGELLVASRSGSRPFHILEAFSDLFFSLMMNRVSLIVPSPHVPRIVIDNLVIQRETWRAPKEELAFALEKEESRRFLAARRWMKSRGLPRRVFVKSSIEVKPFYLDMDSPVSVDIFCKMTRRLHASQSPSSDVAFSEMLPDTENAWLQDASGTRYTSELRLAMVDLKARAHSEECLKRINR